MVGGNLRFADMLSLRIGIHHFSGHYGDEMLKKYYSFNQVNFRNSFNEGSEFNYPKALEGYEYYLISPVEYVRDNSWICGISVDIPVKKYNFRLYSEAELPQNPSWFRPLAHVPADYDNPVDEERPTLIDRIGGTSIDGEQFPQYQLDEEQSLKRTSHGLYKGWRIHAGFEARMNLNFGALFIAGDFQFHQDGQTNHQIGQYRPDNPWELETTIGLGLELGKVFSNGRTARIEAFYHDGRVPATQWFYQRMKYISIGIGIN